MVWNAATDKESPAPFVINAKQAAGANRAAKKLPSRLARLDHNCTGKGSRQLEYQNQV